MKTSSFASLFVTLFVAAPFVPGCAGATAEEASREEAPVLAGVTCAGDDCDASEATASSEIPTGLAEAPTDLSLAAPSVASSLESIELSELSSYVPLLEASEFPEVTDIPDTMLNAKPPQWKAEKTDRFGNAFKLDQAGNLFRFFGGTLKCQVTNNVLDFKMNMHPADEAVAYLVRNEGLNNGVLYALMDSPTFGSTQCPKSFRVQALSNLNGNVNDMYKIVSNTKDWELGTTVSMMAINRLGDLVGWRGRAAVWVNHPSWKAADLSMNTCYGAKDQSFSSYVSFVLEKSTNTFKRVLKVKGRNTVADSTWDTKTFRNLEEFKAFYKVCSKGSDTYPPPPAPPKYLTKLVRCASSLLKFQVCDAQIGSGYVESVKPVKQHSFWSCRATGLFPTFGADSKSVWTADGCDATVEVKYVPSYY